MKEKKKAVPEQAEQDLDLEMDLEQMEEVSGGSIRNVHYTETTDISPDTINKAGQ